MTKAGMISFAMFLSISSTASAQSPASREEQLNCRPDAMKFCSSHVGKPDQMRACLRDNKASLSEPCRKVVEARGG
jgi:hypothetical protein